MRGCRFSSRINLVRTRCEVSESIPIPDHDNDAKDPVWSPICISYQLRHLSSARPGRVQPTFSQSCPFPHLPLYPRQNLHNTPRLYVPVNLFVSCTFSNPTAVVRFMASNQLTFNVVSLLALTSILESADQATRYTAATCPRKLATNLSSDQPNSRSVGLD